MDATFLEMINASNLAFEVILEAHVEQYHVFSQEVDDVVENAKKAVELTEDINVDLEDLSTISQNPLFSRDTLSELNQIAIARRFVKRRAQELAKDLIRKNEKKARK